MAGLSESCSHVAALMFAVEAAVKTHKSKTVTESKAYWMLPTGISNVKYAMVKDIDFTSMKAKKRQLDDKIAGTPSSTSVSSKREHAPEPTETEKASFFKSLSMSESRPVILSIISPYSKAFVPSSLSANYPILFSELIDNNVFGMTTQELREHCQTVAENITVSKAQAEYVEHSTRLQSSCKLWFSFRAGRVTASKLKRVCRTDINKPSESLIKAICYPVNSFSNAATEWGCSHEQQARSQYVGYMTESHDNFHLTESGLILNPDYPFFGASPDGLISCDCCGAGVIEIKCPYCKRYNSVQEAAKDKNFCLTEKDGKMSLKESHEYYYQVQMHMLMTNREFCDFIVWTEKDIHWERIGLDVEFCKSQSLIATTFFKEVLLLELVGKHFSQPTTGTMTTASTSSLVVDNQDAHNELICVCQTAYDPEYDSVIGCDNAHCKYKWLHYSCVGIKHAPKGSWYCEDCRHGVKYKST